MTNPETEDMCTVKCACGNEAIVSVKDLTAGNVTSCGCDGKQYFRCQTDNGLIISSTPIVTCTAAPTKLTIIPSRQWEKQEAQRQKAFNNRYRPPPRKPFIPGEGA